MMPKTIIIYSAVAIMTGSIWISQLLYFIDWVKDKQSDEEELQRDPEEINDEGGTE